MKPFSIPLMTALSLALAACGETETPTEGNAASAPAEPAPKADGQVYSATGEVTGISGDRVTISHGPVEGIGWPAMTMGFTAAAPEMVRGIAVGDAVSFRFREAEGDYVLTSLSKAQ